MATATIIRLNSPVSIRRPKTNGLSPFLRARSSSVGVVQRCCLGARSRTVRVQAFMEDDKDSKQQQKRPFWRPFDTEPLASPHEVQTQARVDDAVASIRGIVRKAQDWWQGIEVSSISRGYIGHN